MNDLLEIVARLIDVYVIVLFARAIMSLVLAFTRYRPSGGAAVAFEFVYTITDPPLKLLRRVIPDIRMGNVQLDLSFLVLIIVLPILADQLRAIAAGG